MFIPDYLKKHLDPAQKLISTGFVRDIEFSGGTYQVQVIDPKTDEECWAFMQLDHRGKLRDHFCSCEHSEDHEGCIHLAAALLKIYNGHKQPLHARFERSFWNHLFRPYAEVELKGKGKGEFAFRKVVYIKGKSAAANGSLTKLFTDLKKATEETSLKFSNLSEEELHQWKAGRPSAQLAYELSYWSDLAKWISQKVENGEKYTIEFQDSAKKIPSLIKIDFPDVEIALALSPELLPELIPYLGEVKSSLKLHDAPREAVKRMIYNQETGCLHIESAAKIAKVPQKAKGKEIGDWIYVPKDGFYRKAAGQFFPEETLCGKALGDAFDHNFTLIQTHLKDVTIHEEIHHLLYSLHFDKEWSLHISAYLTAPGDLSRPHSRLLGHWAFVEGQGFYHLTESEFNEVETVVLAEDLSDFIHLHRTWFNIQEGFSTHLASVEAQFSYHVDENGSLTFHQNVEVKDGDKNHEFGPWIYISGQGFYAKSQSQILLPIRAGTALNKEQVPLFIRANKEELKLLPNFFSLVNPILKAGLNIFLNEENEVIVEPHYEMRSDMKGKQTLFFDEFVYVEGEGFYELPGEQRLPERFKHPVLIERENLPLFLTYELASLRRYAVKIDQRLVKPEKIILQADKIEKGAEEGHYSVKLQFVTERGKLPADQLWQASKAKQRFYFDDSGLYDLEDKRFNWLRRLDKKQVDRRSHWIDFSTLELIRLNAFDELVLSKDSESKQLLDELTEFKIPAEPDLTGLNSNLRNYQKVGVHWLWFLYEHGLSGLLCDDMGLGKTHQAMALMAAICNKQPEKKMHFLVVCPTSVIYHWQDKLKEFLPKMRICTFHGSQRSLEDFHQQYDILLTSYGIWRLEHELLSETPFELAVFDEVQIAKNHTSRIHLSLLQVKGRMKLSLTGTPLENHLRELKALFDLVLPNYMPSETEYKELFVKPIEKEGSVERRRWLTRLIHPFVLRRRKEEVLLDLPEKMEEIAHCDLSHEQARLYTQALALGRKQIVAELQDDSKTVPYLHIFALLSHLKQICDHPAVYLKQPQNYKHHHSGKWDLFVELLSEARESSQKVVVFSQYLYQLDIIEEFLKEFEIGYATIRGATQKRAEELRRFNEDPTCEVFVASLQAAGLGIDLTAASVVIHYDRWWNAARENQATDRVHRIGQKRGVQVFKLVTKDTFEERIDAMIIRKGKLMEEVVGIDDQQIVKSFTRDELLELLTPPETNSSPPQG